MQDVIALLAWQLEARQEHDPVDADSKIAAHEELLRRKVALLRPVTKRKLANAVHAHRVGHWVHETAVQNNLRNGDLVFDKNTGTYDLPPDESA